MSRRILIADDHVPTRRDLQAFFQQRGFEVVAVGNGDLAARRAGEMRPDLVVLDVLMPGKTGYEACRHIKQVLKLESPVLMIHHDGEPFDRLEAERVGADDTLIKPLDPFALLETVNALWRKYGRAPVGLDSGDFSQAVQEEDLEAAFGNGQSATSPPGGIAPNEVAAAGTPDLPPSDAGQPLTPTILPSAPASLFAAPDEAEPQQVAASATPTGELPDPYSVVASDGYAAYFEEEAASAPMPAPGSVVSEPLAPASPASRAEDTVIDQALPFTDPYPSTNFFAPIPTQTGAEVSFSLPERITTELQPPDPAAGLSIRFDTGNAAVHIGGLYEVTEVELPESVTQEIPLPSAPAAETLDEADVSSDGVPTEEVALLQKTGTDILAAAVIVSVTPTTGGARHPTQEQACPHCGGRVFESDILCPHCSEML